MVLVIGVALHCAEQASIYQPPVCVATESKFEASPLGRLLCRRMPSIDDSAQSMCDLSRPPSLLTPPANSMRLQNRASQIGGRRRAQTSSAGGTRVRAAFVCLLSGMHMQSIFELQRPAGP